jgi:hypothetical protein
MEKEVAKKYSKRNVFPYGEVLVEERDDMDIFDRYELPPEDRGWLSKAIVDRLDELEVLIKKWIKGGKEENGRKRMAKASKKNKRRK